MVESRIVKAQRNVIMALMQNILNLVLNLVSRIIFIRILDASYLGINGLFSDVLGVLSLADLGLGTAMMYSLYKPIADNDEKKINALVHFFKKIYLIIALVVLVLGLSLIPFLKYIVKLEKEVSNLEGYYVLALLNVVISYLFVYRTTLLAADQKSYIINKYTMIFKIIAFFGQIGVLLGTQNYFLYLLTALVVSFIGNVFQNAVAIRMYPYLKEKAVNLDNWEKVRIGRGVKATFIYKVSGTIQGNTDNILISIFVGTVYVGYFSNYSMVITAIVSFITLVFTSIKSSIGNMIASNNTSQEEKLFLFDVLEMINFWIIGFCSICLFCLLQDFIGSFIGKEYLLDITVVVVAILNFYTSNIRQTIWTFRETTGLFHETRYITTITAIINLFLSLILGYNWGMAGIIAATVIARMIYAWWKEPMILFHKFFHKSPRKYYLSYIKRMCLCMCVCAVTYKICNVISTKNIYVKLVSDMGVCCIVPNIIFYWCYFKTKEFQYIRERLIKPVIGKVYSRRTGSGK